MEKECGCPTVDRKGWDLKKHSWRKRAFYRTKHSLLFHMPIGIKKAIQKGMDGIKEKKYTFPSPYMMLDEETGFFSAHMLFAIEETPKDDPNVMVWEATTLYSKYHHGPFKGLKQEISELIAYVKTKENKKPIKMYTWVRQPYQPKQKTLSRYETGASPPSTKTLVRIAKILKKPATKYFAKYDNFGA